MQRVLVVEDDGSLNQHVCDLLAQGGYETSAAFDGEEALRIFRETKPHLVILDIFLPGKDGLETLVEMRRESPKTKFILTSGKQYLLNLQSLRIAEELGAATLPKPFTATELFAHVDPLAESAAA